MLLDLAGPPPDPLRASPGKYLFRDLLQKLLLRDDALIDEQF